MCVQLLQNCLQYKEGLLNRNFLFYMNWKLNIQVSPHLFTSKVSYETDYFLLSLEHERNIRNMKIVPTCVFVGSEKQRGGVGVDQQLHVVQSKLLDVVP